MNSASLSTHHFQMTSLHDLFHACEVGDRATVERMLSSTLISQWEDNIRLSANDEDEEGLTALQVAAANDQVRNYFLFFSKIYCYGRKK